MEIILAIVVASAVIFFGALISIGNERQRKAIDGLREQVILWAVQDLKIKREHLVRTVQVTDPLGWLNKAASKICGYDLKLQVLEMFEEPQSLICASGDGSVKVAFSSLSPADLRRIKNGKQNRLSQFAGHNPLLFLPKGVNVHELSVLNGGYLFDLELSLVWKELTGQNLEFSNRLWMYEYS
ncbi:MAG: hypothetical protein HYZ21_11565 [Chloroflexi bacterium]|nr:hypothetical protein [Chloroflexota bacterium]